MNELSNIDVLILCGGRGSRLRGVLPEGTPKCMADIDGEPFLGILVRYLVRQTNGRFVFVTGHNPGPIMGFALNVSASGRWVRWLADGRTALGTGGDVVQTLEENLWRESDPFWVINGDTYAELDYADILRNHMETGFDVTVPYDSQYRHVGTYLLSKRAIRAAAEELGPKFDLDAAFKIFPKKKVLVNWYSTSVKYWDIGTPESLENFRRFWKEKKGDEIADRAHAS